MALGTALEIARNRPGVLAALPDGAYAAGIQCLEAAAETRGANSLEPSEVTVIEVMAVKGKGEKGEETDRGN